MHRLSSFVLSRCSQRIDRSSSSSTASTSTSTTVPVEKPTLQLCFQDVHHTAEVQPESRHLGYKRSPLQDSRKDIPPAPAAIVAFIANSACSSEQELHGLSMLHTVADVKAAVMLAFNLHPAKQSLMIEDEERGTCRWLDDGNTIMHYTKVASARVRIRVYASFELLFKHNSQWLVIRSCVRDTVALVQRKLASEIAVAAHRVSIFVPVRASQQPQSILQPLLHVDGATLLTYGICTDLELILKVAGPPRSNVRDAVKSAAPPPPLTSTASSVVSLAAPTSISLSQQPFRTTSSAHHSQPPLASDNRKKQQSHTMVPTHPAALAISIALGNFGAATLASLTVPLTSAVSQFNFAVHFEFIQRHMHEQHRVHPYHQDYWFASLIPTIIPTNPHCSPPPPLRHPLSLPLQVQRPLHHKRRSQPLSAVQLLQDTLM
jgi:hypothetical protein